MTDKKEHKEKQIKDVPIPYIRIENNKTVTRAEHTIQYVGCGKIRGLILMGPPGMGKTLMVTSVLKEMGVPFYTYGGHISLAEMYEFLFEHSDELIFFDDVSQLINQREIIELLKQALQSSGRRVLHYRSKNVLSEDVPQSFEFSGRIIMAFNEMDMNSPNVMAIKDRCSYVELKFTKAEILQAMKQIARGDAGGLMEYEKMIVTQEIEDYVKDDPNMTLSLRQQKLAFDTYAGAKEMFGEGNNVWVEEVRALFGKKQLHPLIEVMQEIVADGVPIKRTDLAAQYAIRKNMSLRNAQRKIEEALELGLIFQDKLKGGNVSTKEFK